MDKTLESLDFNRLLLKISSFSKTERARKRILSISFLGESDREKRLLLIEKGMSLKKKGFEPHLVNIDEYLSDLSTIEIEGSFLTPSSLLRVKDGLIHLGKAREFLKASGEPICSYVGDMADFSGLVSLIDRTILPSGDVKDSASPYLEKLRREKRALRRRIMDALESFFPKERSFDAIRDEFVTQRSGRFVIPVKSERTSLVKGIVHDKSHRGRTYYIEPFEVVELNNRFREIERDEEEEVTRILLKISDSIRKRLTEIKDAMESYYRLDFLWALVEFSERVDGKRPVFTKDVYFELENVSNPLLLMDGKMVVPFSLSVDRGKSGMIVTGPNGGGKTVFLKTIGLVVALSQCGLFVPSSSSPKIYPFKGIFSYISDEQDMFRSLSTFTAFMKRIGEALSGDLEDFLFIVDELGEGTDIEEGSSLAISVMEEVSEKGGFFVASTHQLPVKGYALSRKDILVLSFLFDEREMKPTYRLATGVLGSSRALQVASLFLPNHVVERAKSIVPDHIKRWDKILSLLEEKFFKLLEFCNRLNGVVDKASRYIELLSSMHSRIKEIKSRVKEDAYFEVKPIIRDAKKLLKDLKNRKALEGYEEKELRGLEEKVSSLNPVFKGAGEAESTLLRKGDTVSVSGFGELFTVVGLDESSGKVKVENEKFRLEVPVSMLTRVSKSQFIKGEKNSSVFVDSPVPPVNEVKVIGKRRDDAIFEVERFLDKAILKGWDEIKVIHGIGTGRLREGIWEYFSKHPLVRSVCRGENPGVTIIKVVRS